MVDKKYIERDAVINNLTKSYFAGVLDDLIHAEDAVNAVPAADVRPVVRSKWEWNDNNGFYYCGNCKAVSPREDQYGEDIVCPNYCPNCGADMRGELDV